MSDPTHRLPRRDVLRASGRLVATIALAGCASLFTRKRAADVTVAAKGGEVRVPIERAPWVTGGGAGTLAVGVEGRDDKILLFRDASGAVAALTMTCTHRGCDVDWNAVGARIVCPCHGSEFSGTGAVLSGPAEEPLRRYDVQVEGDVIVIRGV